MSVGNFEKRGKRRALGRGACRTRYYGYCAGRLDVGGGGAIGFASQPPGQRPAGERQAVVARRAHARVGVGVGLIAAVIAAREAVVRRRLPAAARFWVTRMNTCRRPDPERGPGLPLPPSCGRGLVVVVAVEWKYEYSYLGGGGADGRLLPFHGDADYT